MINKIATLNEYMEESNMVDPMEWSYYTKLTSTQWAKAKAMARRLTQGLVGTPHLEYIKNCGPVEKAGEIVIGQFLDYYLDARFSDDFVHLDPFSCSFAVNGKRLDVHTRMLKFSHPVLPPAPIPPPPPSKVHKKKFLVMVPELGLERKADVYVYCGFDVFSRDGYGFGWLPASELNDVAISADYKHPAKCLPISQIYPMWELVNYLGGS